MGFFQMLWCNILTYDFDTLDIAGSALRIIIFNIFRVSQIYFILHFINFVIDSTVYVICHN